MKIIASATEAQEIMDRDLPKGLRAPKTDGARLYE